MRVTISCREAGVRLSRRLEEPLGGLEEAGLVVHLAICVHCRRLKGQMRLLRRAFRTLGSEAADASENTPKP